MFTMFIFLFYRIGSFVLKLFSQMKYVQKSVPCDGSHTKHFVITIYNIVIYSIYTNIICYTQTHKILIFCVVLIRRIVDRRTWGLRMVWIDSIVKVKEDINMSLLFNIHSVKLSSYCGLNFSI